MPKSLELNPLVRPEVITMFKDGKKPVTVIAESISALTGAELRAVAHLTLQGQGIKESSPDYKRKLRSTLIDMINELSKKNNGLAFRLQCDLFPETVQTDV